MKVRTTVYFDFEFNDDLRQLAFFRAKNNVSLLLRRAVEEAYAHELTLVRRLPYRNKRLQNARKGREVRRRNFMSTRSGTD